MQTVWFLFRNRLKCVFIGSNLWMNTNAQHCRLYSPTKSAVQCTQSEHSVERSPLTVRLANFKYFLINQCQVTGVCSITHPISEIERNFQKNAQYCHHSTGIAQINSQAECVDFEDNLCMHFTEYNLLLILSICDFWSSFNHVSFCTKNERFMWSSGIVLINQSKKMSIRTHNIIVTRRSVIGVNQFWKFRIILKNKYWPLQFFHSACKQLAQVQVTCFLLWNQLRLSILLFLNCQLNLVVHSIFTDIQWYNNTKQCVNLKIDLSAVR